MAFEKKPETTGEQRKEEKPAESEQPPGEVGGPKGPEPTRYGDWSYNGRVTDF